MKRLKQNSKSGTRSKESGGRTATPTPTTPTSTNRRSRSWTRGRSGKSKDGVKLVSTPNPQYRHSISPNMRRAASMQIRMPTGRRAPSSRKRRHRRGSKQGSGERYSNEYPGSGGSSDVMNNNDLMRIKQIKQEIMENNFMYDFRYKHVDDSDENEVILDHNSEKEFENLYENAASPDDYSPTVREITIQMAALNMSTGDNKQSSQIFHTFLVLAVAINFTSVLDVPVRAIQNGGYVFLLQFLLCMLTVGWPAFMLEIWLGQYTSLAAGSIFGTIAPILRGFHIMMPLLRGCRTIFTRADALTGYILNDMLFTILFGERKFGCFRNGKYCRIGDDEDVAPCTIGLDSGCMSPSTYHPYDISLILAGREIALQKPTPNLHPLEEMKSPGNPTMICMSVVVMALIYVFASLKPRQLSIAGLFLFAFPALALVAVIVEFGVRFEMNLELNDDWWQLLAAKPWFIAFYMTCEVLSLGDGTLHSLGALMPFHYNTYKVFFCVAIASTILPVVSFFFVVPVTHLKYLDVRRLRWHNNIRYGFHAMYIELMEIENNRVISWGVILFFLAVFVSQFAYLVFAIDSAADRVLRSVPEYEETHRVVLKHCTTLSASIIVISGMLISYRNKATAAYYERAMCFTLPCIIFTETVVVSWNYGYARMYVNIQTMLGEYNRTHQFACLCLVLLWKFVTPVISLATIIVVVGHQMDMKVQTVLVVLFGVVITLFAIFMIVYRSIRRESMMGLFHAMRSWGPLKIQQRMQSNFDEKASRILL